MILTREIIKRILGNFGVAPPPDFGKSGLTNVNLRSVKELVISFEEDVGIHKFPIWTGEAIINSFKLKALIVDLSLDDIYEYALTFRLDDKPIYSLKLIYDDIDQGIFLIQDGENWITPNILVQAQALVGMEIFVSEGILWSPCEMDTYLYDAVSVLIT
jgi:hypothetical protein